jgi:hypothetical protein
MSTPSESQQPIPFRPSAASVGKLLVALIERKSGVVPPTGWGESDLYYLGDAISAICEEFGDAIDRAATIAHCRHTLRKSRLMKSGG